MTATCKIRLKVLAVEARMLGSTPAVLAIAVSGAKYQLRHRFADLAAAERVAQQVAARRSIDADLWDVVGVTPNSRAAAHLRSQAQADVARHAEIEAARLAA